MLAFQCDRTVTREEDRIIPLKVNPPGDGTKGPVKLFEILKECTMTCRIEVLNRKLPLKLHIDYQTDQ